jgi:hypothetical protein
VAAASAVPSGTPPVANPSFGSFLFSSDPTDSESEFGLGIIRLCAASLDRPGTGTYCLASLSPTGSWDMNRFVNGVQNRLGARIDIDHVTPQGVTRHLRLDCAGPTGGTRP